MVDFLKQIVDFLTLIVDLVVNTIEGFLEVLVLIPVYTSFVSLFTAALPSLLVGFVMYGFLISVLLFMVGRK